MNLDDLTRPTLRYRVILAAALVLAIFSSFYGAWEAYEGKAKDTAIQTLTQTNSRLAHMIDVKLDSMANVLNFLSESDAFLMDALRDGGPRAVDSILRRVEDGG